MTSQKPLTVSDGSTAVLGNLFAKQDLSNPALVPEDRIGKVGRQYDSHTPYSQTLNLTIQDQFTNHDSISVAYVSTLGRHLDRNGAQNADEPSVSAMTPMIALRSQSTSSI
jgi:hypothetical protein